MRRSRFEDGKIDARRGRDRDTNTKKISNTRRPLSRRTAKNPVGNAGRPAAVLLLGPTGSGKTPLGRHLQAHGLGQRRCEHFDFGANLRRITDGGARSGLGPEEIEVIVRSLRAGSLLEDEHFPIAGKILGSFIHERDIGANDLVVLNGLPRHAGQAKGVDSIVRIEAVIYLRCPAAVVHERIRTNAGGDRTGRTDDEKEMVRKKMDIFARRTGPLVDHYRQLAARIETVDVAPATTARDILETLNSRLA